MLKRFINQKYDQRCSLCRQVSPSTPICETCYEALPFIDEPHNNLLFRPDVQTAIKLSHCDELYACCWYQYPINHLLTQLKFFGKTRCAHQLTFILQSRMEHILSELFITHDKLSLLPLSRLRLINRGFNQVAKVWLPLLPSSYNDEPEWLCKSKHTGAQTSLNRRQRLGNTKHAYTLADSVEDRSILLIDDVVSTGATMSSVAALCHRAGAKKITVLTCALNV